MTGFIESEFRRVFREVTFDARIRMERAHGLAPKLNQN